MSAGTGSGGAGGGFGERHGIHRRRAAAAAAVIGAVLVVSLYVMNERIRARRTGAAEPADSVAAAAPLEATEEEPARAAWADPREARKLAGDTLPVVPGPEPEGGDYVPLGRDVGPGEYAGASRGGAGADTLGFPPAGDPAVAAGLGADPARERLPGPAELRRAAFDRAVASRELRTRRHESGGAEAAGASASAAHPPGGPGAEGAGAGEIPELRPYGAAQVEEDSLAAQRAAGALGRGAPQALLPGDAPVGEARFAASGPRPCRRGERVLPAGHVITATLVSEIDSEVPGPVVARIGRDVYDARIACVLFPAGSLLVGRYPEALPAGGRRLVVVWEQVRLGDGRTWPLPALPAADRRGAMGVPGRVDRRTRELLETAALLSAFGAALAYAAPGEEEAGHQPGTAPGTARSSDRAAAAAVEPFRSATGRLLERAAEVRPVLRLGAGHPIAVIVPRDVDLEPPAASPGAGAAGSAPAGVERS